MKSKEEKLREALNEYFGRNVGDVKGCFIDPASPTDYIPECPVDHTKQITILTKQHVPTFAEKRKELVDQLDNDLKEIDRYLRVTADGTRLHIYFDKNNNWICSLDECMDPLNNLQLYDACLSVTEMSRITNALSEYCRKTYVLRRRYEDETI